MIRFELTDGFWGQFALTQLPHCHPEQLLPMDLHLQCMINFAGMLEYLCSWEWKSQGVIGAKGNVRFALHALPLSVSDDGEVIPVGHYVAGQKVFSSRRHAFEYAFQLAKRDLQYRGFRDDRLASFHFKQTANLLLYERVLNCADDNEYELLQQSWDIVNRPKYSSFKWSPEQQRALDLAQERVSYEDEATKRASFRWLYIAGAPGSGKSAFH